MGLGLGLGLGLVLVPEFWYLSSLPMVYIGVSAVVCAQVQAQVFYLVKDFVPVRYAHASAVVVWHASAVVVRHAFKCRQVSLAMFLFYFNFVLC